MDYVMDLAKGGTGSSPGTEEEEDVFYLVFKQNPDGSFNDDTTLSFTNSQADGKHRVRFACRVQQTMRVDMQIGSTWTGNVGYESPNGFNIPKDCKSAVVHVDEPRDLTEPIAVSIGT
jgi:hypothetical protein